MIRIMNLSLHERMKTLDVTSTSDIPVIGIEVSKIECMYTTKNLSIQHI